MNNLAFRASDGAMTPDPSAAAYAVDAFDTAEQLWRLKPVWEALYENDPEADFFLSFKWLSGIFRANPGRWSLYAVRHAGRYVCLFPARRDQRKSASAGVIRMELRAAGRLTFSEYTGFICDPAHAAPALAALAQHLSRTDFSRLSLRYEPTGTRSALFAAAFPAKEFRIKWPGYRINGGQVDCLICPRVVLPGDFETYLATGLSHKSRKRYRRHERRYLASGAAHITVATPGSMARDLDILFDLWAAMWRKVYSPRRIAQSIDRHRRLFEQAHALNMLYLPILWRDGRPLGALAHLADRDSGHCVFKMAGRDQAVTEPPVGLLLHVHSIRWAIANGFRLYDFGHGNEAYKYRFGATDLPVSYLTITRRGGGR